MAGLLDNIFASSTDDPRYASNMALFGKMVQGDFGGGLLAAGEAGAKSKQAQQEAQYRAMQIQNMQAEAQARQQKAAQEQAEIERQRAIQQALPSLYGMQPPGGQPQGQGMPQAMPQRMPQAMPMPEGQGEPPMEPMQAPMQAPQMQPQMQPQGGGRFDAHRAALMGMHPDMIQKYAAIDSIGRQEVARLVNVPGPNGEKMVQQLDKFGQPVGKPMTEFEAAQLVNLGDRQAAVIPRAGMSLPMGMSPEAKASNALGWANHGLTKRGQDMTDARARESNVTGKAPAGYRVAADGKSLEFIPGGPADPNAAKKAAPTEFQGKAAMFGSRAAEADKIIQSLDGKYSPSAINTKKALGNVWGVGGALESVGNAALPANAQKAEQAERDFVNAVLRLESGAAIGKDEFDNARKQYFPQPFDSAAVKQQKAENRARAIQGLMDNARTSGGASQSSGGASGGWSIQRVN
jgi:hypothetical protein